jgi:hypothetical protein
MSEILTNKLTGTSTAGNITITNGTTTQKLQDGVVSTYSLYDQQNTAIDISLNISSVTDVSTGKYTLNFSNNYATTKEYVVMASAQTWFDNGGSDNSILYNDGTTSTIQIYHWENGTVRDTQFNSNSLIGDLA